MPLSNPWLFSDDQLNKTPSIIDGYNRSFERGFRIEGARFIQKIGNRELNLHHCTVATGTVFFHRFYMYQSFKTFHFYPMAAACLFLAGKVEETPKKSNDIVKVCRKILSDNDFQHFTQNGLEAKEELLTLERILLHTLRFDLEVEHPYEHLLKYVSQLKIERNGLETSSSIKKELIQSTWTFLNDACCTTICLQYEPEIIAIAMLLLSCKVGNFRIVDWDNRKPEHKTWWDAYVENLDEGILENICHNLLDVYQAQQEATQVGTKNDATTPNSVSQNTSPVTHTPASQPLPSSQSSSVSLPPVSLIPPPPPHNNDTDK